MKMSHKYLIKLKIKRYYKWVIGLLVFLYLIYSIRNKTINVHIDPSLMGIVGVLIGSALAAIFSYINTDRAHRREAKRKEKEYRKKEVYSPLYDNLYSFIENIKNTKFPFKINHETSMQNYYVSFTEWTFIKKDTRIFSISIDYKRELNNFIEIINGYNKYPIEFTEKANDVIDRRVEQNFEGQKVEYPLNFVELIDVLLFKERFINRLVTTNLILKGSIVIHSKAKISQELAEEIYAEILKLPSIIELQAQYDLILNKAKEILEMLKITLNILNKDIYGRIEY